MVKKLLSVFCTAALLCCTLVVPTFVNAAKPESLVLFGDSISTGYGLSDKSQSFGKQLENALGLTSSGYHNYAADGATSAQILLTVKAHAGAIVDSNTVLLTAGGNDLLAIFLANAKKALGLSTSATTQQLAVAMLTKPSAESLIAAQLQKPATQVQLAAAGTVYAANMLAIVAAVKAANPSAKLYIQTVYNPFGGITGMEGLSKVADTILGTMNKCILSGASTGGYSVIDTAAAFKSKAQTLTNMAYFDIHPNKDGHRVIFQLSYTAITGKGYVFPAITSSLSSGKLKVRVSGLPAGAAQLTFTAVSSSTGDTQKKTVSVAGSAAAVIIPVKDLDYSVTITELNTDKEAFYLNSVEVKGKAAVIGIRYAVRMSGKGWSADAQDGVQAGTTGKSYIIQALRARLTGKPPSGAAISYQTYLQGKGWQKTVINGTASTPDRVAIPVKSVRFTLKGMPGYTINYRIYLQSKGWLGWVQVSNGTALSKSVAAGGTAKAAYIQAVEVKLVKP